MYTEYTQYYSRRLDWCWPTCSISTARDVNIKKNYHDSKWRPLMAGGGVNNITEEASKPSISRALPEQ